MTASAPIFKRDTSGNIRTWQYEVDGGKYRTIAGIEGGNLVTAGWTVVKPKNEGRANATTVEEQAIAEATAEETKKLDREYRRTKEELDLVPASVMLAQDYAKLKKPLDFAEHRVFCQPKLDGIRAIINKNGAFTREYQRHFNCDHILAVLAPVFEKFPNVQFDGELYNHDLKDNFNQIVRLVRKQTLTDTEAAEVRRVLQFHIYDMPSSDNFSDRMAALGRIFGAFEFDEPAGPDDFRILVKVETAEPRSQDDLDVIYGHYTEAGYEGQMVRLDEPYGFDSRSKSLLKRKEFKSAEFPVLRIEEGLGNWAGCAKRIVVQLPNGQECGAGMRGTQIFAKELLAQAQAGKQPKSATIRYFGETPDGALRFPVAVDFQAEGRVD